MTVLSIQSLEEFDEKIQSMKPVVIDFGAERYKPCREISPVFEQFSEKVPGVDFCKVDVDAQMKIIQEMGIIAWPTFILFQSGNKVKEIKGTNRQNLQALIVEARSLV
ncbi:hypothetical protein APHAL10511_005077 [Amanita phalloides]|nr:hypothetical protein APHAL10511_005077 [Amanita phalloides]